MRTVGLPTFNLDIIYGAAGESLSDWEETVEGALSHKPPHVSAYGLTVEAGTPLAGQPARHPDDDDQADKYELVDERFAAAGLVNYEVSNWSRPGHESKHNFLYWRQQNYRGFGLRSALTPQRATLVETFGHLTATSTSWQRGESVEAASETLDANVRRVEGQQLVLRTRDGIERSAFDESTIELLDGMLVPHADDADRVVLTRSGRLMANEISMRLRD